MRLLLDPARVDDYRRFVAIKGLPCFSMQGRTAVIPDEYAARIGAAAVPPAPLDYTPLPGLFDYQRDIAAMAIRKRKFAIFADCGLGKHNMMVEFARNAVRALAPARKAFLIVSPLMVIPQAMEETGRFYGDGVRIRVLASNEVQKWLDSGDDDDRLAITNYEAMNLRLRAGRLGGMALDESSMLKSHYGKWGQACIALGRGLDWKLALTGTPAPNDRIEFANHAVFLDQFPTVNAFLARFFVNRGQTGERWELKPHALHAFYRALSHWCIFLNNPATYGWGDNTGTLPPVHIHIQDVALTSQQREIAAGETGMLFAHAGGGIATRGKLAQLAKGRHKGADVAATKPAFIRSLVDSWPGESTIVWCRYNAEQESMERTFPEAASIRGDTPHAERMRLLDDFKAGRTRILISKARVLGFGLNLQICTRQVFSGLQDSYEEFYQAVKRSNRYGSTRALNVHIPITEIERPMVDTVLAKARRVESDAREQERIFREHALA